MIIDEPADDRLTVPANAPWTTFSRELTACSGHLLSEVRAAAETLALMVEGQQRQLEENAGSPERRSLDHLAKLSSDRLPSLLFEPLRSYRQQAPLQRLLVASDTFDRSIEQLVCGVPDSTACAGPDWQTSRSSP